MDGHFSYLADGQQGHGVGRGVGVGRGEGESGGGRVANEERCDRQAELVGEITCQGVAQDVGTAFDEEGRHGPFIMKVLEHGGEGELGARVDDNCPGWQCFLGGREGRRRAVDQGGARAGEEAGRRV